MSSQKYITQCSLCQQRITQKCFFLSQAGPRPYYFINMYLCWIFIFATISKNEDYTVYKEKKKFGSTGLLKFISREYSMGDRSLSITMVYAATFRRLDTRKKKKKKRRLLGRPLYNSYHQSCNKQQGDYKNRGRDMSPGTVPQVAD